MLGQKPHIPYYWHGTVHTTGEFGNPDADDRCNAYKYFSSNSFARLLTTPVGWEYSTSSLQAGLPVRSVACEEATTHVDRWRQVERNLVCVRLWATGRRAADQVCLTVRSKVSAPSRPSLRSANYSLLPHSQATVYSPVVLKLGYSCHLWHFDQKIVTLCLYFYVTLLTQRCKERWHPGGQKSESLHIHCTECTSTLYEYMYIYNILLFVHVMILTFVHQTICVLRYYLFTCDCENLLRKYHKIYK